MSLALTEAPSLRQGALDEAFMDAALAIGRRERGRTWPNPAVGAVVLDREGRVAGRGWTAPGGRPHAETEALERAGAAAQGGTAYVTLEPCSHHGRTPPCAAALLRAGIARAVVALQDPNPLVSGNGLAMLRAGGVAVELGVRGAAAARDLAGHLSRMTRGRPHVQLKIAASADGKSALAGRRPVRITGEQSRAATFLLRASADAVMVGIGTVLADDPELTCRLPGMEDRSPLRVVLDSQLRTPIRSRLGQSAATVPTLVVAREDAPADAEARLRAAGVEVLRVPGTLQGRLALDPAMRALAAHGLTCILVEGGPILSAALLEAGLVDELLLFRSAGVLGEKAIPAIEGSTLDAALADVSWTILEERRMGTDCFTRLWRG